MQRRARVARLLWKEHRPERRRDLESVPVLAERTCGLLQEPLDIDLCAREHDELAPAETVCRIGGHRLTQPRRQPYQERVPGGMAERVVVVLEAIQVEQRHQPRVAR